MKELLIILGISVLGIFLIRWLGQKTLEENGGYYWPRDGE